MVWVVIDGESRVKRGMMLQGAESVRLPQDLHSSPQFAELLRAGAGNHSATILYEEKLTCLLESE